MHYVDKLFQLNKNRKRAAQDADFNFIPFNLFMVNFLSPKKKSWIRFEMFLWGDITFPNPSTRLCESWIQAVTLSTGLGKSFPDFPFSSTLTLKISPYHERNLILDVTFVDTLSAIRRDLPFSFVDYSLEGFLTFSIKEHFFARQGWSEGYKTVAGDINATSF